VKLFITPQAAANHPEEFDSPRPLHAILEHLDRGSPPGGIRIVVPESVDETHHDDDERAD
jgi:hypothetical protein